MYGIFFILSSVEGHVGCFPNLAVVNRVAMNKAEQVSLWLDEASFGWTPKSGIAES